jgi:osmotically-inducible protein OsmY
VEVHNHLRTNDGILADIWAALWKEAAIRSLDMDSISIQVKDGEVYLNGHLAKENNLLLIESIVRSVEGVVAVHSHLVQIAI